MERVQSECCETEKSGGCVGRKHGFADEGNATGITYIGGHSGHETFFEGSGSDHEQPFKK